MTQELTMIIEIKQIAETQLGEWLGVDPVYQPAAIHHWQEVYDLACQTEAYERDQLARLKRENATYHRLLHNIDQTAPCVLSGFEDEFRWAVEAVREVLQS